jgi:hypothetical protein
MLGVLKQPCNSTPVATCATDASLLMKSCTAFAPDCHVMKIPKVAEPSYTLRSGQRDEWRKPKIKRE